MARVTVDDCLKRLPNRFQMTLAATYRARQLASGATPLVETEKGGTGGGGGARLTPLGTHVLDRYRQMEADADAAIAAGIHDLQAHLAPPPEGAGHG